MLLSVPLLAVVRTPARISGFMVAEETPVCAIFKKNIDEHLSQKIVVRLLVMEISITRSTQFLWVRRILSFVWPSPGCACETGIPESSVLFLFFK